MKKFVSVLISLFMLIALAACGAASSAPAAGEGGSEEAAFDTTAKITVTTREEGSGTRGAFIELFGIEEKNDAGEKIDQTTENAEQTNNTEVMISSVAGNPYAIGYVSLGSLNGTVAALEIDGVAATVANIKDGSYAIARPFNVATLGETKNEVAKDFLGFIMSDEGQAVVESKGYIAVDSTGAFESAAPTGKAVVAGSSSVTPVMEKLVEAYLALNPGAEIEIQQSDSSMGMTSAIDGICDIGMASRELKDSELDAGLVPLVIAMDGIAVIVNLANVCTGLTKEQVKGIYVGEITVWSDVVA